MPNASEGSPTLGPYVILEKLGNGSFASVYRCEHTLTHQKYAGKLYDLDFAISETGYGMVRREVSILKLLRCPKVIRFQEAVYTRSGVLIVMELVEGVTLLNVMPSAGGIPESFARPIFRQILEALFFLHCNGIVHRDLKLENIMIQKDGDIKLIDFGLADYVPQSARKEGLLIKNRCGSPHYYAPEMILAVNQEKFRGDRVDIWAAGVLLYSLVTGFHPFYAEHERDEELFQQIINHEVTYDTEFSKELEHLLRQIFIKDPNNRISLQEIQNHPWTNNTLLGGTADSWIEYFDTTGSSSSRSRLLDTLSHEQNIPQVTTPNGMDTSLQRSGDEIGEREEAKHIASFEKRTSSTEAIDGDQAVDSVTNQGNAVTEKIGEAETHATALRRPNNVQEPSTHNAAVRKSSTNSARKVVFKCRWPGLKDCLKGMFGRKDKPILSNGERTMQDSEESVQSEGDENRPPSTSVNRGSAANSDTDLDFEGRRSYYKELGTPRDGPFWKVSFLCWANL